MVPGLNFKVSSDNCRDVESLRPYVEFSKTSDICVKLKTHIADELIPANGLLNTA